MAWRHGTRYGYQDKGCRCEECREAVNARRREHRRRGRLADSPAYRRELATARAIKERYRGTCEDCGAPTSGCNGWNAPRHCVRCSARRVGEARRGQGPMQQRCLALLANGPRRFLEIRDILGVSSRYVSQLTHRLVRGGEIVRVARGVYALPEREEEAA